MKNETFGYDVLGRLESDDNALANCTYGYLGETDQVTSMTPDSGPFGTVRMFATEPGVHSLRGRRPGV